MLRMKNLDSKSFDDRMSEALSELPLYTEDWTNFNPSDPGVTILENLTAFSNIQLTSISEMTDAVRFELLKMCGFTTKRGKTAKILLMGKNLSEEIYFPPNKQMFLGDMCFETDRLTKVYPYRYTAVYGKYNGKFHDCSHLIELDVNVQVPIFGNEPKEEDAVYFISDGMPAPGEEMISYVSVANRYNRNPFLEKGNNIFASIEWQVYTENGFETVNVKDASAGFLLNGEIRIKMPESPAAIYDKTPIGGYCIRGVIKKCAYDITPKVIQVVGFLFEVYQKQTLSSGTTFQKPSNIKLFNDMAKEGYIRIFGKEKKGTSYYQYDRTYFDDVNGRYCRFVEHGPGMYEIVFDKKKFGFGPEKTKNAVKVIIYSEELMKKYHVGTIIGFDNEDLVLPIQNIVPSSFSLMLRRLDENGAFIYDFASPGKKEDGALKYSLFETEGRIVIEDPGDYVGAEVFIATATVFRGKEGNIRAGNTFITEEGEFINPGNGVNGCYRETLEQLHKRFLADLQHPYTAVTENDYETLVKEIPQLCIRKVKAYADTEQNLVKVAVMPGTDEHFPMLSDLYKKEISAYLDARRLITTRIEIVQPVYVPVSVYGTIYIKKHYSDCRQIIEDAIKKEIDYTENDCNFGETLSFNHIFHAVESLSCVEYIYDLSLKPQTVGNHAKVKDSDVIIGKNVLLYPGEILLDIGAYQDNSGVM